MYDAVSDEVRRERIRLEELLCMMDGRMRNVLEILFQNSEENRPFW
jgi:hypothetical protein